MDTSNKICRACLDTSGTFTHILHQNVSQEMFWFCTSIQVLQNDNLPKSLCSCCYELLTKFSEFKQTCIQSNNALTSVYDSNIDEKKINYIKADDNDESLLLKDLEVKLESPHSDTEFSSSECFDDNKPITRETKIRFDQSSRPRKKVVKSVFNFSCEKCNSKFKNQDRYEAHKLWHEGKSIIIECNICHKVFTKWQGLVRHKKEQHSVINLSNLQCPVCGRIYKSSQSLIQHRLVHMDTDIMICDICGKAYKTKVSLMGHLKTHDRNRSRTHTCEQCGGKFFSQSALQNHRTRRHNDRRFICHYCSYPFRDKYNLMKHLAVRHEGKKPHKCDTCSKSFTSSSTLREHMRYHSGERPFECSFCLKKFVTKRMLIDHQFIHTGEKPHKCSLCTQAFAQKGTLNRHMRVHEKPVQL